MSLHLLRTWYRSLPVAIQWASMTLILIARYSCLAILANRSINSSRRAEIQASRVCRNLSRYRTLQLHKQIQTMYQNVSICYDTTAFPKLGSRYPTMACLSLARGSVRCKTHRCNGQAVPSVSCWDSSEYHLLQLHQLFHVNCISFSGSLQCLGVIAVCSLEVY